MSRLRPSAYFQALPSQFYMKIYLILFKIFSIIRARQNDFINIDEFAFDGLPNLREIELFSARDCRIGFIAVENASLFDLNELKEELRDNCKGSDFKIMEMHAAMLETIEENGDSLKIY